MEQWLSAIVIAERPAAAAAACSNDDGGHGRRATSTMAATGSVQHRRWQSHAASDGGCGAPGSMTATAGYVRQRPHMDRLWQRMAYDGSGYNGRHTTVARVDSLKQRRPQIAYGNDSNTN
jgi:hypothetical protein